MHPVIHVQLSIILFYWQHWKKNVEFIMACPHNLERIKRKWKQTINGTEVIMVKSLSDPIISSQVNWLFFAL